MAGLFAAAALKPLTGIIVAGAGAAILLGGGFAAGVGFEHRGHQGFPLNIIGQSLKVQRDAALADVAHYKERTNYWYQAYLSWHAAEGRCEDARRSSQHNETNAVTTASGQRSAGETASFNSGYTAGRVAGRRTCGAPHAPTSPDPIGDIAARGVRQPPAPQPGGGSWGDGAYHAPGSVPAHR